jgi:inner membrane protein
MPTIMSHSVAAAALAVAFPKHAVPPRVILLGAACSIAPDVDVFGVRFGLQPGDLLDHRGITHSLLFAVAIASVAFAAALLIAPLPGKRFWAWMYLLIASASHGLLDAMTDRTGLGIPFFWPFDSTRYFFSFSPIAMSPIGTHFFSERGLAVFLNEFRWIWIPSFLFVAVVLSCRRMLARKSSWSRTSVL